MHDTTDPPSAVLATLAGRVRALRRERGWTRADLSRRSGLSVRFLARVESGDGNISVLRLDDLARALGTTAEELLRAERHSAVVVCLVGLRGAGKSTVGPRLAERLAVPFLEMDAWIVEASGLPIDQLFELHGEAYYRRLEREAATAIVGRGAAVVVAAAGGVVTDPETWRVLRGGTLTVWLRADPEDHWRRVVAQGDGRPMANHPGAMDELRVILRAREPLYAQADLVVDTTRLPVSAVVDEIVRRISTARAGSAA
jgi:XRE family aerobic/anaerobic benzoate catabolism transcriptional regulator